MIKIKIFAFNRFIYLVDVIENRIRLTFYNIAILYEHSRCGKTKTNDEISLSQASKLYAKLIEYSIPVDGWHTGTS